MANKNETSTINVVINGESAGRNLREMEAELRKVRAELRGMGDDNPKLAEKKKLFEELNERITKQKVEVGLTKAAYVALTGSLDDLQNQAYEAGKALAAMKPDDPQLNNAIIKYQTLTKTIEEQRLRMFGSNDVIVNQKRSYDSLGNSINQLSREMPAFANSVQTGFMAISNNLPTFFDEITKLKQANADLAREGKPTESILKQVAGSIFSVGTALSVGVTLLTVYGGKIYDYIAGLNDSTKAIKEQEEALKKLNDERKKEFEKIWQPQQEKKKIAETELRLMKEGIDKQLAMSRMARTTELDENFKAYKTGERNAFDYNKIRNRINEFYVNEEARIRDEFRKQEEEKAKKHHDKIAKQNQDAYKKANDEYFKQALVFLDADIKQAEQNWNKKDEAFLKHMQETWAKTKKFWADELNARLQYNALVATTDEEKYNAEKERIEAFYAQKLEAVTKGSEQEKLIRTQLAKELENLDKNSTQAKINQFKQTYGEIANTVNTFLNLVNQNETNDQKRKDKQHEIEKQKLKKQLDDKLISQEQYDTQLAAINAKQEEEQKALMRKQAERQKMFAVFEATIKTALAWVEAFIDPTKIPGAIAASVQTALIAAMPLPEFFEGGFTGKGGNLDRNGGFLAMLHEEEYVVNKKALQNPMVNQMVRAIETGTINNITNNNIANTAVNGNNAKMEAFLEHLINNGVKSEMVFDDERLFKFKTKQERQSKLDNSLSV